MTRRVCGRVVVGAVLGICVLGTAARIHVWGDEQRLWMEAVRVSPEKPRPWVNLGKRYHLAGADGLAAEAYETAIQRAQAPGRGRDEQVIGVALAQANLALVRFVQGRQGEAAVLIAQAIDRKPNDLALRQVQRAIRGPE